MLDNQLIRALFVTVTVCVLYFSVSALQTVIAKACHISEDKQVLLISGGESLDPAARVCKYSAGTVSSTVLDYHT